jgi:N-acetylglucosamine kinase-like BadF-type ATPase
MTTPEAYALGLDGGGTATRWALAGRTGGSAGAVVAEGSAGPVGGLMLLDDAGRASVAQALHAVAGALPRRPAVLWAGLTGFDASALALLQPLLERAFGLPPQAIRAMSDIELLCRCVYPRGEGCVLYAGTGAIAARLAPDGTLDRAGGRGAVIDDAGGGHWIAREALRRVWRAEDEAPGAWRGSLLAERLFARIGGSDWAATRQWVYGASRGEIGTLALAVAEAANAGDTQAQALLEHAGQELARLVGAMRRRFGPLPFTLAGRVFELHPAVEQALRRAAPPGGPLVRLAEAPHRLAAQAAAQTCSASTAP